MIKHISFDLWLTLIKSNPLFKIKRAEYIASSFNPLGLSEDTVSSIIRKCDKASDRLNEYTGQKISAELMYRSILKRMGHSNLINSDFKEMISYITELFHQYPPTPLNVQVINMLQQLKREGYSLNISSNTGFIEGNVLVECRNLSSIFDLFEFYLFSDEINASKPSALFFGEVLKHTNLKKNEILHIGDNKKADFEGATSFGFHALLIENKNYSIDIIKEKINETNRNI